jgi:gamma-glutamylcyclotransferase (GGCT)/AIG2-like uncharacterized protein YtfP
MSVREMALDFSASALGEIADAAEYRAALLAGLVDGKVWRLSKEQRDALDTFRQLAAYSRRVIAMQSPE